MSQWLEIIKMTVYFQLKLKLKLNLPIYIVRN